MRKMLGRVASVLAGSSATIASPAAFRDDN